MIHTKIQNLELKDIRQGGRKMQFFLLLNILYIIRIYYAIHIIKKKLFFRNIKLTRKLKIEINKVPL